MDLSKLGSGTLLFDRTTGDWADGIGTPKFELSTAENTVSVAPGVPGLLDMHRSRQSQLQQLKESKETGGPSSVRRQSTKPASTVPKQKVVNYERPLTRIELAQVDASLSMLVNDFATRQPSSQSEFAVLAELYNRCDELNLQICEIMSVVSSDAGRCAYKLRHAYHECFQSIQVTNHDLDLTVQNCKSQIQDLVAGNNNLRDQLAAQEKTLKHEAEQRISNLMVEVDKV